MQRRPRAGREDDDLEHLFEILGHVDNVEACLEPAYRARWRDERRGLVRIRGLPHIAAFWSFEEQLVAGWPAMHWRDNVGCPGSRLRQRTTRCDQTDEQHRENRWNSQSLHGMPFFILALRDNVEFGTRHGFIMECHP